MYDSVSLLKRLSMAGLYLTTLCFGVFVARDQIGNRYYRSRVKSRDGKEKRWVLYHGDPEPTKISPEFFAWIHKMQDLPLLQQGGTRYQGNKRHYPNLTGTNAAILSKAFRPSFYDVNEQSDSATQERFWRPAK